MIRTAEINLEYQNYIERLPVPAEQLYTQATSNDHTTIQRWKPTWIKNIQDNHKKYGPFKDNSIAQIYGTQSRKPVICVGSGPSLKHNAHHLKDRGDICIVSCLHNFHFLEDLGIDVDYYVTLDAGEVTIEEVYEGGTKTEEEYWKLTENKILLAFIGTSPRLLEKWRGKVLFYNSPIPDAEIIQAVDAVENFHLYVGTGGNVLGACTYIAKGYLGANPIAFMGADFSFSYERKFHAWSSKYDQNLGHVMRAYDVFGMPVLTWQSYHNFKGWFEYVASSVPGLFINCTEGGILGSYIEGNLMAIPQMQITKFIEMYKLHLNLKDVCQSPEGIKDEKGNIVRKLLF